MNTRKTWCPLLAALALVLCPALAVADGGGVTFSNIADDPGSGLTGFSHKHTPSQGRTSMS